MAPLKPEYALSKAKELVNVNKSLAAIDVLCESMKVQKKMWVKTHEEVMMLLAQLCVDLKKSLQFKETIHQYKNMTLQMNPKSLEDVVKFYLSLAKKQTDDAREKTQQLVVDIDDLDNLDTPESLILNAVNMGGEQDRHDRAVLTPWLKFLWESYRMCLDLLRNNSKFERLYHDMAIEAYEFCQKYDRKNEFRKLCDIIRQHMIKYQSVSMTTTPDTWGLHLEIRLKQLDYALNFKVYNDAFKIVEDIWQLLENPSVNAKPRFYANYYAKAAQVLFESGSSRLFHAAALQRLFFFSKDNKRNMPDSEVESLATRMIIATLAVPLPTSRDASDSLLESGEVTNAVKQKTLSQLLHLPNPPTRGRLIKDITDNRVIDYVCEELRTLYNVLECDYRPLSMAKEAALAVEWLNSNSESAQYVGQIRDVITAKTLIQVGKVYKTIKLEELSKICPYLSQSQLHINVITLIRNLELPILLDHRTNTLIFDAYTDLGISQKSDSHLIAEEINGFSSLSKQLSMFANAIFEVAHFVGYVDKKMRTDREECRELCVKRAKEYHNQLANRRNIIEDLKEEIEQAKDEAEKRTKSAKVKKYDTYVQEEAKRLRKENDDAEQKKLQEKLANEKEIIRKRKIDYLMKSEAGNQVLKNVSAEKVGEMDEETLIKMQNEERIKIKEAHDEKLRKMLKKVDFFQRALRQEEIPLTLEAQKENFENAQKAYEEKKRTRIEEARKAHIEMMKNKEIIMTINIDISRYLESEKDNQSNKYDQELQAWNIECDKQREEYRVRRMAELAEERRLREEIEAKMEEERKEAEKLEESKRITSMYVPAHLRNRTIEEKKNGNINNVPPPKPSTAATTKYIPIHLRAKQQNQ